MIFDVINYLDFLCDDFLHEIYSRNPAIFLYILI